MRYIRFFSDISANDVATVGGKNASLGEMYCSLNQLGVNIPNGFAVTAQAYEYFIRYNQLEHRINQRLDNLDHRNIEELTLAGAKIRHWIRNGRMPKDLIDEIRNAYQALEEEYGLNPDVAVRSSATAEDLPSASFAGQQETYLNIRGSLNLIQTCQTVFASLFTDRAIAYRQDQGFVHSEVALSIGVQKMVRSDLASSGVMFTLDTESGFRDVVLITSAYGLGENIVQGMVNPDEFYVFKPTLETQHRAILKRQRGDKAIKMIYTHDTLAGHSTRNVPVNVEDRECFSITDNEVLQLASYALTIEKHYSKLNGKPMPMDIEWAKDGVTGELFIVQARPETVKAQQDSAQQSIYRLKQKGPLLVTGKSVGQRIACGKAKVIHEASQMREVQPGDIIVTEITDPDWEPIMKTAAAIVTNRGGRTCHAAIVARELGIPAVVGCGNATQVIRDETEITVSCAEGDNGYIYEGCLPFDVETINYNNLPSTKTKIMLNLGNPEQAFEAASLPVQGVGLARLEFIINNTIGVHPRALLDFDQLDSDTQNQISELTSGYADKISFYVDRLAEGVGTIAAAFYPKPVIVRMSDFKSNEYASLLGGRAYEPIEENPMIGFRGAARYFSEDFQACFALECQAMKKVREEKGLDNVALMIPFVRTIDESTQVLAMMEKHGLKRGENNLKIYLMCEIPANALLANDFLAHFDGFSIGSNDLTQLTLGVDRDSDKLNTFDERNPAVLKLMELAIQACKQQNKYIGICGQAPSDYPEITQWLVRQGIDSISLNADSVVNMIQVTADTENQ
ncbi:MAG: phosphoenolpyruvate synthase [Gammaproteobacteria bacterium]|nr:phosphoenolpyruvate synthase [Gammaproteobacteria bacterium]MDH5728305.1 phosphoenolpyruvate synthase [Gammaproteobacteria bacterium]